MQTSREAPLMNVQFRLRSLMSLLPLLTENISQKEAQNTVKKDNMTQMVCC